MANPQLENGFIRIATEIWEKLGHYRLSGEEWLVLNCIIRKTYGWQKKEDYISFTQFEKYTGLKRASVYRAMKKLLAKKLIGVSKRANSQINLYCFNKHFNEWISISKRANSSKSISKRANRVSVKKLTEVLALSQPTIDNKDTNTKDSKNSLIPCTDKELQQISIDLNMPISRVQLKHETILDKIAAGEYKYKTVYRTLREWLRRDKEKLLPIIAKTPEEIEEDKILNAPYPPGALEWKMGIKI